MTQTQPYRIVNMGELDEIPKRYRTRLAKLEEAAFSGGTTIIQQGGGETNVGENVGTSGVGTYHAKSGVSLQFRKLNSISQNLNISLNGSQIDLDVTGAGGETNIGENVGASGVGVY